MELTFVNPQYLWLLLVIPFLILTHFYGLKFSRRKALKFANFEALSRVSGAQKLSMNLPLLFLRFFTLFFLIFSLSGPIMWYLGNSGEFNFVIAIDASGSMLANDFSPTRLEAAKRAATTFLDYVPSDSSVGVLSFSGVPFVKESPTTDSEKTRNALEGIRVEYSSGTAIGDAIIAATNLLLGEEKGRSVILLTDGQSNTGAVIEKAINYANDHFATVQAIGMGTLEGGTFSELEALSVLDDDTLKSIAQNTGGKFYLAQNQGELEAAYREIAQSSLKKIPFKLTFWLTILTFISLSLEWVIVNTKFRSVP